MAAQAPSFRNASRLNKIQSADKTFPVVNSTNANQKITYDLPKFGFGARIVGRYRNTMALGAGGAPVLADRGPWSIIDRYRFFSNQGGDIHSVTGWGAYKAQITREFFRFVDAVMTSRTYATNIYSAPITANASNAWVLTLELPLVINQRDEAGLLLLQNEEATFTLEVTHGAETSAVTGASSAAAAAGSMSFVLEAYSVPAVRESWPQNLRLLYQLLDERLPVTSVGADLPYSIPRGSILRRMVPTLTLNGARTSLLTDLTQVNLLYNQTEVPLRNVPSWYLQYRAREQYGNDLPVGVWPLDWTDSGGFVGLGDARDYISTPNVSDLQLAITIGSGATLGSNNNYADFLRDQIATMA